jgi:hypothetical protein
MLISSGYQIVAVDGVGEASKIRFRLSLAAPNERRWISCG